LSDYYNENCPFLADFSTNAYVFVFSIVPMDIGMCLFPSINPYQMQKKYKKRISISCSVCRYWL